MVKKRREKKYKLCFSVSDPMVKDGRWRKVCKVLTRLEIDRLTGFPADVKNLKIVKF